MPSGAKARENSSNHGTAEAVPFQGEFSRRLFEPLPTAPAGAKSPPLSEASSARMKSVP
jgi:hypothetical protein